MSEFMSEEQFNKLHDLLRLCEEKGITRDVQYRIAFEMQTERRPEDFLAEIEAMIKSGAIPRVKGMPCKISLHSDAQGYGPLPMDDEPIIQRVTLRDDGWTVITYSNFSGKRLKQERFSIDPVRATALIRKISTHFSIECNDLFVSDVGSWELTITNTDGQIFKESGCLFDYRWYSSLSDELRELLERTELYAFDGYAVTPLSIRICNCVFDYGGKEYCYQTDDKDIHEEQQVIVPMGSDGRTSIATVVSIEYLEEDELLLPVDQIKFIIRPFGNEKDFEVNSDTTLYEIVKTAIDAKDCEYLLAMEAPADEYDGESQMVVDRIRPEMDKYQIASIIAEVMSQEFSEAFSSKQFTETATWIKTRMDELYRKKG